ncbi:hypothetical protein ACPPVV_07230 [Rhodanobacter sp. Col0626]|uniref:hypothetical protein n=1 Tax=Rhodanobacter sp. Col0626 TaxID=3415679 RepID=UPI003CEB0461
MNDTVFVVRGFTGGRRQTEERFTSELHAKRRAAYLGALYESVMVGCLDDKGEQANGIHRKTVAPGRMR